MTNRKPTDSGATPPSLKIVVVNTVVLHEDEQDPQVQAQLARSRALRIGLLQAGYNIIATIGTAVSPVTVNCGEESGCPATTAPDRGGETPLGPATACRSASASTPSS